MKFNSESCVLTEALSFVEMIDIEGGNFAYDLGHFIGEVAHDVVIAVIVVSIVTAAAPLVL